MNIEIIPADYCHAHDLAPRLRQTDKDEVYASGGMTPLDALTSSLEFSDSDLCRCALINGVPEIMWGVGYGTESIGVAWLLGTDRVSDIRKDFWIESIKDIALFHERYDVLTNWVHVANIPSLTWLDGLGFQPVEFSQHYGYLKQPFIRYESRRP